MNEQPGIRACAVVPYYDHPDTLPDVVDALLDSGLPVVVVDDGSPPESRAVADGLTDPACGVRTGRRVVLIRHRENRGKGSAVISGLRHAASRGFTHVIQVDADAQHDLNRLTPLLEQIADTPNALVLGRAVYDDSVPGIRKYSRYLTHIWVWINCLSFRVRDSMCGFRAYPIAGTLRIIDHAGNAMARRMGFDVEICVRSVWEDMEIIDFPIAVNYPHNGKSHFRPIRDNLEITWVHTRCFAGMLYRAPPLLLRMVQGRG